MIRPDGRQLPPRHPAGLVNRHLAQAIEYLVEENRVLKEPLGNNRLRLTDDQRRRIVARDTRTSQVTFER